MLNFYSKFLRIYHKWKAERLRILKRQNPLWRFRCLNQVIQRSDFVDVLLVVNSKLLRSTHHFNYCDSVERSLTIGQKHLFRVIVLLFIYINNTCILSLIKLYYRFDCFNGNLM